MPDLIEIGLDVLQSVQPEAMSPYALKRRYGDRFTFWGALGSQRLIPFGTPAEIRAEVRRLAHEMGRGGGYVLGLAKALQPETPTENAVAVVEAFWRRRRVDLNRRLSERYARHVRRKHVVMVFVITDRNRGGLRLWYLWFRRHGHQGDRQSHRGIRPAECIPPGAECAQPL